jgi:hypothetical protein
MSINNQVPIDHKQCLYSVTCIHAPSYVLQCRQELLFADNLMRVGLAYLAESQAQIQFPRGG